MKKVLIAALVSALPAAAMADVTVYGIIKGGVESVDAGKTKETKIEDVGSRIGFKGNEDLGNGLKAIWQVETAVSTDDSSNSGNWASRQSFIGLTSDFGTIRLGNLSNFGDSDMGTVDPYEYNDDALGLGIYTRGNTRVKNAVRIDSPEYAGFKAAFLYGTEEDRDTRNELFINDADQPDVKEVASKDRETYNLGLGYEYGPMFAKYAYTYRTGLNTVAGEKAEAGKQHQLEVGYEANNLFLAAGYRHNKGAMDQTFADILEFNKATTTALGDASSFKSQEFALTAAYSIGNFTPKFTYAQGLDIKADGKKLSNSGYEQIVVGTDYALSKRTVVSGQYGQIKRDSALVNVGDDDTVKAFGAYITHAF
ncbi:porin [Aquitalea sp. S1-19]|nr:porin [Aquitalea sp. S1-19]